MYGEGDMGSRAYSQSEDMTPAGMLIKLLEEGKLSVGQKLGNLEYNGQPNGYPFKHYFSKEITLGRNPEKILEEYFANFRRPQTMLDKTLRAKEKHVVIGKTYYKQNSQPFGEVVFSFLEKEKKRDSIPTTLEIGFSDEYGGEFMLEILEKNFSTNVTSQIKQLYQQLEEEKQKTEKE